jgi:hypothetical protein
MLGHEGSTDAGEGCEGLRQAQQERCGRHGGGDLRGVRRPTMPFVQVNSVEQQGLLMQHRTRDLLLRQRGRSMHCGRIWPNLGL